LIILLLNYNPGMVMIFVVADWSSWIYFKWVLHGSWFIFWHTWPCHCSRNFKRYEISNLV